MNKWIAFLQDKKQTNKQITLLVYSFFAFGAFFPTIRLLILGSAGSTSISEFLISALPEILFISILFLACVNMYKNGFQPLNSLDYSWIIYLLYNLLVGFILAKNIQLSIYATRMTYLPMAMYFVFSFWNQNKYEIEDLQKRIFQFFLGIAVLGILLYFVFPNLQNYFLKLNSPLIAEYFIIRMTSVFWTPVVFGAFVSACIIYFFYLYLATSKKIHLLALAVLYVCLFMSVSRGSMIVVTLGILILALLAKNGKKLIHVLGVKASVFILVSFYISNPIDFMEWILTSTSETAGLKAGVTRVELWLQSFEILKNHPFGLGLGKAGHVATRFFAESQNANISTASTDGWFLKLMLETGFLALFFYLFVALYITILAVKHYLRKGFDLISFVWVFFFTVNVQNLVSNVLDFQLFSYFYWMILGVFSWMIKQEKNARS